MTTLNSATNVEYKVYIAGVLVPCSQVTVTTSTPGTSSAQISMPADPLLISLGDSDRLQIAIFYLDSNPILGDPKWCLLFEGFLIGQNYTSSPLSRDITFFALSNIAVFDSLYLEFLGGKGKGRVGKADKITPDEIIMKGNYPRRFFTRELKNKVYVTRAFDLIGNIFLATTGRFLDRDIAPKTSSKNIDKQIDKLAEVAKLNRKRQLANSTDLKASLLQLITSTKEELDSFLKEGQVESQELVDLVTDADTASSTDNLEAALNAIDRQLIANTIKESIGKRNTFVRTPASTGFFARYFNLTKLEQHFVASPIIEGYPDKDVSKLPSGIFPILKTARGKKYLRAITRQTGRKFGQGGNVSSFVNNLFLYMNYELTDIIAPPIYLTDKNGIPKGRFEKGNKNNRIAQYVTKPATNYGLPPTCNTIFPCMIRNFNYGKQYNSIPTRLYYERASQGRRLNVKSGKKGYADHGAHVGYPAKITRHAQDASKLKTSDLEVLVFPEEYYRGPNCVFEELLNPLLYEIKKQENASRIESASKEDKSMFEDGSIPADQVNLIQEALLKAKAKGTSSYALYVKQAQIDYANLRTKGTTLSVNMVFNPNMVAGFSTMLFDSFESNCHMVGKVAQVTHTLTQGQSSTSVSITNARSLKEMLVGILNQGSKYAMHPVEPLSEVREVFQVEEVANYYFGNLLYRNSSDFTGSMPEEEELAVKNVAEAKSNLELLKQTQLGLEDLNNTEIITEEEAAENQVMLDDIALQITKAEEALSKARGTLATNRDDTRGRFVLNWKALIDIVESNSSNREKVIEDVNKLIGSQRDTATLEEKRGLYEKVLRGHIMPKKKYEHIFYSLPVAMAYVARPVCTLEEYIDFYKYAPDFISGASSITGGRGRGTRAGKISEPAMHYRLIREFVGGPGFEPGSKVATKSASGNNVTDSSKPPQVSLKLNYKTGSENGGLEDRVFTVLNEGDTPSIQDLPDLAQDSQKLLLLYSDIIKSRGKL